MKQALGIIFCLFLLLLVCTGTMAEELKLPQNLKTVADDAFLGDQSVTAVVFPDGLEAIGKNAFANTGLTAVTIPASVTQIGEKAFAGCKGLIITCERGSAAEAYAIANDIPCVFMDESPLSDFIFTPLSNSTCSVTGYIGSEAVVVIPSRDEAGRRVDNIGDSAFSECDSLVSVTIPYGVTSLTCYAFYGCKNLTSINIPSSMTDIDNYVFCDAAITSVSIPASVRYIGEGAFAGCEKLTHIDVSAKNKDYASRDGILYNKYFQTIVCYPSGLPAESFEIPSGVTAIDPGAFEGSPYLKSVTLPSGVTVIGKAAFSYCGSLTSFDVPEGVTVLSGTFTGCPSLASVTMPEHLTTIGDYTFEYCRSLTEITIPSGVTSIGKLAFDYCEGLTDMIIPDGVTSIGDAAFWRCSNLTGVTIPASVTSIGERAFEYCYHLTIRGKPGSAAEAYAIENDLPFQAI